MEGIWVTKKIQDLIYRIRIKHVMRRDVFCVTSDTFMEDLKDSFKQNPFSCVPVLDEDKLIGQITIEDYIDWLGTDNDKKLVSEVMSEELKTYHPEEPVITAIRELEVGKYRGIPVINPDNSEFLGLICRLWLVESILSQLDLKEGDLEDEELHQYRASHFFDDVKSDNTSITLRYEVKEKPLEYGGEIASAIRTALYRLGASSETVRKVAIAAYEAEINILTYAKFGFFTVKVSPFWVELRISDNGPGIPDIDKAMKPGFSTAPEKAIALGFGAGMGLPNIQDCCDSFRIESAIGEGTTLKLRIEQEKR